MNVEVEVDGVSHSVEPTAGDLVRLEREYGVTMAQLDAESVSIEHVLFLAFVGLRRVGVIDRDTVDFDRFLDLADVPNAGTEYPPPSPLPVT